jgi:uroporphyrinogen decarboxylase
MTLTHRDRLEVTLSGQKPDRPPVALWRHFPVDDQEPNDLAASVIRFQERFDFDFVKVTPASTFCLKEYGLKDVWQGNPEGTRHITEHPVVKSSDWMKIKPLDLRKGSLAAQLSCLALIRKTLPDSTPVIQTIFSPLSQCKNLVGKDNLVAHLRLYPEEVNTALQALTRTTFQFIEECVRLRIDGVFYAVQHAQFNLLTETEFQRFGETYDTQVLEAAKPLWFNVGHIHGQEIMFDRLSEYPVQVLNWHDLETPPDLITGKKVYNGAVCGGLRQWETLAYGTPDQVTHEAKEAIRKTDGQRFILGTGCVTPIIAPDANLFATRKAVEQ